MNTNYTSQDLHSIDCEVWDHYAPEWREQAIDPEDRRFVSEDDFPVYEETVSDEDWQAFIEMSWSDPMEWDR